MVAQGVSVVGVDLVFQALQMYVSKSEYKWAESCAPQLGTGTRSFTVS